MDQRPQDQRPLVRRFDRDGFAWEQVARMPYKDEGAAPFRAIARQVLFAGEQLGCELRYFEIAACGHSTLERHEHEHAVMILRGRGRCLLGASVHDVGPYDLVTIPSWTWHQFRASGSEPMGFLCMVNTLRDRPQLPSEEDLAALLAAPGVAAFLAA